MALMLCCRSPTIESAPAITTTAGESFNCPIASVEVCDGLDNDGDGQTDEGFDADQDGVADCFDVETCDGLDNDGDGQTDDGFDSVQDGLADCFNVETCDGLANDGDGLVDEGFPDLNGDGFADCFGVEPCNCKDDDGDGQVDEGCLYTVQLSLTAVDRWTAWLAGQPWGTDGDWSTIEYLSGTVSGGRRGVSVLVEYGGGVRTGAEDGVRGVVSPRQFPFPSGRARRARTAARSLAGWDAVAQSAAAEAERGAVDVARRARETVRDSSALTCGLLVLAAGAVPTGLALAPGAARQVQASAVEAATGVDAPVCEAVAVASSIAVAMAPLELAALGRGDAERAGRSSGVVGHRCAGVAERGAVALHLEPAALDCGVALAARGGGVAGGRAAVRATTIRATRRRRRR